MNIVPKLSQNPDTLTSYGSDPQLPSNNTIEQIESSITPPNYVFHRNKRQREANVSPTEFSCFKQEIKELITNLSIAQKREFAEISENLKDIRQTNSNIDSSISLLTTQNEEFRKKIEFLEQQSKKDREYISILEDKIEDLQKQTRKSSIELKNVPIKQKEGREDLIQMATSLATTIKLDMSVRDIKDIYRIKGKNSAMKNTPVIVELTSNIMKTDLLKKAKKFNRENKAKIQAKHLGFKTNEETPIFISEQLTARGSRLYFLARDLTKTKKYKYCWTSFGKVYIRKDDSSKIIQILNEAQIHQLQQDE